MKPLGPPDNHHLSAAQGWFELGDSRSAADELKAISAPGQLHPAVLMLRWELCARVKDWKAAYAVAQAALDFAPEEPGPWIQRSFALHELKLTQEALDYLLLAADKFPKVSTIPYNLACYCCQLGRLPEAIEWLDKALQTGDAVKIQQSALEDPDLAPLRDLIRRKSL